MAIGALLLGLAALGGCARSRADEEGRIVLRMSHWGMVQESQIWEEMAEKFHRRQNRIRIKLEHIAGQNYHTKVLAMHIGNCAPDILAADDEQFRQLASSGLYADLNPFIRRDKYPTDTLYPVFTQSFAMDGKQFALPFLGNTLLVYYNREHRRAAGLTPDPDPNWTWDDFDRDAIALTRDFDGDGRKDQFGLNKLSWFYCLQWIWSVGGRDMDPGMTRYVLDTPEAKRGFQFHYDHIHKYKVCPMAGDLPNMNAEAMFFTGKVSMFINGSWWMAQCHQAKNLDWDVAPIPRGPLTRATRATAEGIAISPQCPNKEAAWEWIQFVLSEEGQQVIAKYGRGIPSVRSVARKALTRPDTPQHEEYFLESLDHYARPSSLHKNFMATDAVFNREWDRLMLGQLTVDEWVKATLPEVNAIVRGEDL